MGNSTPEYRRNYYKNNKEKIREYQKRWREKQPPEVIDHIKKYQRKYRNEYYGFDQATPESMKAYHSYVSDLHKAKKETDPEYHQEVKSKHREYNANHKDERGVSNKIYYEENREDILKKKKIRDAEKKKK